MLDDTNNENSKRYVICLLKTLNQQIIRLSFKALISIRSIVDWHTIGFISAIND
jgi:hypothetical protein